MAISKLPLTKVVRASLIDAVNKINEIIDFVNTIQTFGALFKLIQFGAYTSNNNNYIYIQWNNSNNYNYRMQINVTNNEAVLYEQPSGGNMTRKFKFNITIA